MAAVTPDATTGGSTAIIAKSPVEPWLLVLLAPDVDLLDVWLELVLEAAVEPERVVLLVLPAAERLPKTELLCADFCAAGSPITATAAMSRTSSAPAAITDVFMPEA